MSFDSREDTAAEVGEALLGIEVPCVVGEQHTVVVKKRRAQSSFHSTGCFWFPPAMGYAQGAGGLCIVEVRENRDGAVCGCHAHVVAFGDSLAGCIGRVDVQQRFGCALAYGKTVRSTSHPAGFS